MKSQSLLGISSIVSYVADKTKVTKLTTIARLRSIFEWVIQDLRRFGKCRYQRRIRKIGLLRQWIHTISTCRTSTRARILLLLNQVQMLEHECTSFSDEGPAMWCLVFLPAMYFKSRVLCVFSSSLFKTLMTSLATFVFPSLCFSSISQLSLLSLLSVLYQTADHDRQTRM